MPSPFAFPLAILAMAGAFVLGQHTAAPQRSVEGVLAQARSMDLQPCFFSRAAAAVHLHEADHPNPTRPAAGTVQGGLEQGAPIPEGCFAVQTGLFGASTTYWQQPLQGPKMPVWNPLPATP